MTISTTIYNSSEPKSLQITARAGDASISRQAMLFVAWGVITLFYCIVAVGVYVSTMAKADDLGKIYTGLVYTVSVQWSGLHSECVVVWSTQ